MEPQTTLVEEVIRITETNIEAIITKLKVGKEPLVVVSKYDEMS
jgi:predicted fused transcriptional regulator/phosphomethylpyrimidine kinase